ncbi:hypothetical protein SOVF_173240 [Spinacia oleracea]|uniref:VQ motif-containing protein 20 n=1 Tax=Spinacia oleracea TaxID=3562 RepID=A0A9R0HV51_SPIOL|nr:VQ motif-containing protein 20 [Spinacia oleracea]KNA07303.1 hypothetical protein SOVF_173240 [Spinacia oleracea]
MSPPPSFQQQQDDHQHHHHPRHHPIQHLVKQEVPAVTTTTTTDNNNSSVNYARMSPSSSVKIQKNSHMIKKSIPVSGSSIKVHNNQQPRGPVIIYTHSPKVIHTNPRDFKALVQKLTGMSSNKAAAISKDHPESGVRNGGPAAVPQHHPVPDSKMNNNNNNNNNNKSSSYTSTDDNESSSVITDENSNSNSNSNSSSSITTTATGDVVGHEINPYMCPPMFDLLPAPPNLPMFMPSSSDMLCSTADPPTYDYMDFNFPYDHIT